MQQKHEHEDFYNQRIKQNVEIIWVQIKYYLIGLAGFVIAGLASYWLGWWPITMFIGLFLVVFILMGVIWFISPTLWQPISMIVRLYRQKRIALQHPAVVTQTIWNAYNSVQNELVSWSEKRLLSTRSFRNMFRIYYELDGLSDDSASVKFASRYGLLCITEYLR